MDRRGLEPTPATFSALLGEPERNYLKLMMKRLADQGVLIRAARGVYVNPHARSMPGDVRAGLVRFLRPSAVTYVSLESKLSEAGAISQVATTLTCMTTGSPGRFDTPWGTIEFTHTNRQVALGTDAHARDDGVLEATAEDRSISAVWDSSGFDRRNPGRSDLRRRVMNRKATSIKDCRRRLHGETGHGRDGQNLIKETIHLHLLSALSMQACFVTWCFREGPRCVFYTAENTRRPGLRVRKAGSYVDKIAFDRLVRDAMDIRRNRCIAILIDRIGSTSSSPRTW